MERISGYARVLARTRVHQEKDRPFIGKPFLKYGQCYVLAGYFFQLGSILAAKHRHELDAFGHSFLGLHGESGAFERFCLAAVETELALLIGPMSFADYVQAEQTKRFRYTGDSNSFLHDYAMQKIDLAAAEEMAWQFAEQGSILGATHPDISRKMFEWTHRLRDEEKWNRARAAGLDIPVEQDIVNYEEIEDAENNEFMSYCHQCCPSIHSILAR